MIPTGIPTLKDVEAAAAALEGITISTPLMQVSALEELTGANSVHVKLESMQRTGSFKFRGAYWRCLQLSPEERERGVVAYSSENFAQGLAAAAQTLGNPCTIVMPVDAPEVKRRKTEGFGATVVQTDHGQRPREEVAAETAVQIAEDYGKTLLHPFDDISIVTGHASLAIEVLDELARLRISTPDDLLCCVGGGGLLAGIALGCHVRGATTRCTCVEPVGYDSMGQSLRRGSPIRVDGSSGTICDALQATRPGDAPFAVLQATGCGDPLTVDDAAVREAMRFAHDQLKITLEPSGSVALAALMGSGKRYAGLNIVAILTGGNIEMAAFADIAT